MEDNNIITLVDEEGNQVEMEIIDIIEDDGKRYAAGVYVNEEDAESEEDMVYIMRIVPANDEEDMLEPIEDEAELNKIYSILQTRLEEEFEFTEEDDE